MIYQVKIPKTVTIVDLDDSPVEKQIGVKDDGSPRVEKWDIPFYEYIGVILNHSSWKKDLETIDLRADVRNEFKNNRTEGTVVDIPKEAWDKLCEAVKSTSTLPWSAEVVTQLSEAGYMKAVLEAPKKSDAESKPMVASAT